MRLRSILWMVITPLLVTTGAVLLLTPKDILRQPVFDIESTPSVVPRLASDEGRATLIAEAPPVDYRPATLTVVASSGGFRFNKGTAQLPESSSALDAVDRRWITAGALNLRTGPGTANDLIASLPFGTSVVVLERSGSWARVEVDGLDGWLSANFLTDVDPALE